jgi:hypothetical protein
VPAASRFRAVLRTTAAATLIASAVLLTAYFADTAPGSPSASSCGWRKAGPPRLSPVVAVESVAARSASNVWLVGFGYRSPADDGMASWHWNGRRWIGVGVKGLTALVTPLFSVASAGGDAWAVGRLGNGALALHWNVRNRDRHGYTWWARVRVPRALASAELNSVVMVAPRDLWAVGPGTVLRRRRAWARVKPPPFVAGASSFAMSKVPGTTGVWISGYDEDGDQWRAARWTGSSWEESIVGPGLIHNHPGRNIAAVSSSDAWIVGRAPDRNGKALVYHWDGSAWAAVTDLPLPAGASELSGVAARSASDVWAVGSYLQPSGRTRSLALHWNGARWSRVATPGPGLTEVAMVPGSKQAWAVGGSYLGKRLILDNVLRYRC